MNQHRFRHSCLDAFLQSRPFYVAMQQHASKDFPSLWQITVQGLPAAFCYQMQPARIHQ